MAKTTEVGYEITARGTFFAAQDRNKVLRTWGPEVFEMPLTMKIKTGFMWKEESRGGHKIKRAVPRFEEVNCLAWANHIVQRYLLPARLSAKYKDFVRFHTCQIINTSQVHIDKKAAESLKEENIETMTLEQLRALCALKAVALPLDSFADVTEARKAVRDELQNLKLAERRANKQEPESEPAFTQEYPEAPETETYGNANITTAPVTEGEDELFG